MRQPHGDGKSFFAESRPAAATITRTASSAAALPAEGHSFRNMRDRPITAWMAAGTHAEKSIEVALTRIATLPQNRRIDALVGLLAALIEGMDTATLRRKRARLLEHFASCGCSIETVALMTEWVDCQLALRRLPRRVRSRPAA